ncbi:MAG: hypothetical protein ABIY55_27085 [Kofleriaceae bacterium]
MTARDDRFRDACVDAGAFGAVALHRVTRAVIAGFAYDGIAKPALLDLLLGTVRPSGALTQLCGGSPPSSARELYVAGVDRALYCTVLERGEVIMVAAPATMSVALGWTLVRGLAATEPAR